MVRGPHLEKLLLTAAFTLVTANVLAALPANPPHNDRKGGYWHARDKDLPYTSHCTDCHAPNLDGGLGPSCRQCHINRGKNPIQWNDADSVNAAPPLDHTLLKGGFALHKPGFGTPLTSGCTSCHGANLNDGFAPSCYGCHGRIWAGQGPPLDHKELKGGTVWHRIGYDDPIANGCTQCHGPNLNDGFAPSCYGCHGPASAPHNFAGETWLDPADSSCTPCHDWGTWKHTPSPTTGYTVSATTLSIVGDPTGASAKCLGCHEGNIAVDDFIGTLSTPPADFITGSPAFGTDLTHHHPVGMAYDDVLAMVQGGLLAPSTALSGLTTSGTIDEDMLDKGRLQCTACHDPHDNGNGNFLVKTVDSLCSTCHKDPVGSSGHHIPRRDAPWTAGMCSKCHGADLLGAGIAPACTQCHNSFTSPDTPPSGHHGGDRYDPLNACASCHGAALQGGTYNTFSTPACNDCHGDLWLGNRPPIVDAGGPYSVGAGQTVAFDASGTVDPDGDLLTYAWDFGDGTTPQISIGNPSTNYVYDVAGNYAVKLTVTDGITDPVVVAMTVKITTGSQLASNDVWRVSVATPPPDAFTITFQDHDGVFMAIEDDGVNQPSLAFGMERDGVIFWVDLWMDPSGTVLWGTGSIYFGNIDRIAGRMLGVVMDNAGGFGTFTGTRFQ